MSTRFECPRCQTVFVEDAAEQAFAECPQCGSLALPRGEVTAEDAATLRHSVTAGSDPAAHAFAAGGASGEGMPLPPASATGAGIFNALLGDSVDEMPPGVLRSDPGSPPIVDEDRTREVANPLHMAALSLGPASSEGLADDPTLPHAGPSGQDDDTLATSTLPPSLLLTRQLSGEGAPVEEPAAPPAPVRPASLALTREGSGPTPRAASPAALFDGGDDEFDPFKGLDLPEGGDLSLAPPMPASPPSDEGAFVSGGPTMELPTLDRTDPGGFSDDSDLADDPPFSPAPQGTDPAFRLAQQAVAAAQEGTLVGPPPAGFQVTAQAVTLSELEAQLPEGTPLELFNPLAGSDLFADEAFGDLEKAFDEVALSPGGDFPMSAEEALRAMPDVSSPALPVMAPRPPERPQPPPMKLRRADRPPHLSLSPEAIEAAALPLRAEESSGRQAASDPFAGVMDRDELPPHLAEETDVIRRRPSADDLVELRPADDAADEGEAPRRRKKPVEPLEGEERLFRGFTLGRVAAAVVIFLGVGAGLGAVMAPSQEKPRTPRVRAQEIFAAGNRFYDEGRFDDALGSYRQATIIDPSFGPAHRALGAALVKERRFEEAAEAYEQYLGVSPDAIDADQVKAVLTRYHGKAEEP